ncbi:DNA adenine methylase [Rubrivivax gelatinosus]|uniref:Site-specific DNA-methyltransferase (adenine-specific) n=1 Tax=Rubrivivax gelatinosus TaxID=28068 RepID=A0ABS1DQ09_RUBGE|nr:DNA adenine methylase [Rubrivivax gelatinosus]MBK1711275.1 hypothetical protein [Rubrivivax gelatinosus]
MSAIRRPALRYHGGKFRLAPWVAQFFPPHSAYAELFGGAASLLLLKPPVPAEVYNDLDARVVNYFRVLRDPVKSAELQRRCSLTPYARAELEWSFGEPTDDVDAAHRLVVRSFLGHGSDSATRVSRTGFRARLTDGRALNSAEWATWADCIPAMRDRLMRVLIENDRAERIVDRMDGPGTLFYADPPYLHSTRSGKTGSNGYLHEMSDDDHAALLERMRAAVGMVVLSGYPSALYDEALQGWERHERRAIADCAAIRTEVVWLNPACSAALARSRGGLFEEAA